MPRRNRLARRPAMASAACCTACWTASWRACGVAACVARGSFVCWGVRGAGPMSSRTARSVPSGPAASSAPTIDGPPEPGPVEPGPPAATGRLARAAATSAWRSGSSCGSGGGVPAASAASRAPSTAIGTGPATSMTTAHESPTAVAQTCPAGVGTGRASGRQLTSAASEVKASSAGRPSRPIRVGKANSRAARWSHPSSWASPVAQAPVAPVASATPLAPVTSAASGGASTRGTSRREPASAVSTACSDSWPAP